MMPNHNDIHDKNFLTNPLIVKINHTEAQTADAKTRSFQGNIQMDDYIGKQEFGKKKKYNQEMQSQMDTSE